MVIRFSCQMICLVLLWVSNTQSMSKIWLKSNFQHSTSLSSACEVERVLHVFRSDWFLQNHLREAKKLAIFLNESDQRKNGSKIWEFEQLNRSIFISGIRTLDQKIPSLYHEVGERVLTLKEWPTKSRFIHPSFDRVPSRCLCRLFKLGEKSADSYQCYLQFGFDEFGKMSMHSFDTEKFRKTMFSGLQHVWPENDTITWDAFWLKSFNHWDLTQNVIGEKTKNKITKIFIWAMFETKIKSFWGKD